MRKSLLSILLTALLMAPSAASARDFKASFSNDNAEKAIAILEAATGYDFVCKKEIVNGVKRKLDGTYSATSLKDLLNEVVRTGMGLDYEIVDNMVILRLPSEEKTGTSQQRITGTVTDENGDPLPGAHVYIAGTKSGTATDIDGNFSLFVPAGGNKSLIVSFVGMKPFEMALNKNIKTPLDIKMQTNYSMMDEVVVTGYQEVKKEKMTGSVATISSDKLNERYMPNILNNLEGRVAGLSTYGGKPVIRGIGTLYGETNPLLVVDGLPIEGKIEDLNPYDIESVNVLKDAAAAAIYGARAANGIIVITTKDAKKQGKIDIDFSANVTWYENRNVDYHDNFYMNAAEHVEAESKYWEYYFFNNDGKINKPIESTTSEIIMGSGVTRLNHAYWQFAKGDITRQQLDATKAKLSQGNYAQDVADNMFHRQVIQQYNLALRNKSDKARNSLVINYKYDNTGLYNHKQDWLNVSYKGSLDVAKWLTATFSFNGVFANKQEYGATSYYIKIYDPFCQEPYYPYYDENGNDRLHYFNYGNDYGQFTMQDDITDMAVRFRDEARQDVKNTRRQEMRYHADLLFKVLPGLTANAQFIYEVSDLNERHHATEESFAAREIKNMFAKQNNDGTIGYLTPENGGFLQTSHTQGDYWTARGQLNYNKTLFDKHDIAVIAGMEFRSTRTRGDKTLILGYDEQLQSSSTHTVDIGSLNDMWTAPYWQNGRYPVYASSPIIRNGIGLIKEVTHRYASGYFNATYTFDERYNVFGSFRKDYADVYGLNAKYRGKPLWSVGAGWNIHKEDFMHDLTWINFLKLRYSYGVTGNIYQGATSYMTASSGSINRDTKVPMGSVSSPANPNLRWEQNRTNNFGLDFSFLGYRLRGSLDYYRKEGKDIFGNKLLDPTSGFTSMNANVACILNHGVELTLGYDWFRPSGRNDFSWTTNMTFTYNKNKVTYVENPVTSATGLISTPYKTDYPVNAMWAYRFAKIDDRPGHEGVSLYYTETGATTEEAIFLSADALAFVGHSDPSTIIALDNQMRWKGFSFGFTAAYYGGHQMFARPHTIRFSNNWFGPIDIMYLNAWTPEKPTDIPGLGQWSNPTILAGESDTATNNVYDADFIKIRNITFGYDLPKSILSKVGVNNCSLRFQINDPKAIWTRNNAGVDPETLGIRNQSSYVVGLNLNL